MADKSRWNALRACVANRRIRRAKSPQFRSTIRFESLEMRALLSVQPLSEEALVNVVTDGDQRGWVESLRAVASDGDGNYVITWSSDGQDGSGRGVFARRYSGLTGQPVGDEMPVNQFSEGDQLTSTVAMDAAGNFVVAWASADQDGDGYGVFARRFNAIGEPIGDEFLNHMTGGEQVFPAVAMNAEGGVVVAWQSKPSGGNWDILARTFDHTGNAITLDIPINSTTDGDEFNVSVAATLDGQFAITWTGQDATGTGVFARILDPQGAAITPEFQVNQLTEGNQGVSTVAPVGPSSLVFSWWAQNQVVSTNFDIVARVYSTTGNALTGEIAVNVTPGVNTAASVAGNGDGAFAIAWTRTGDIAAGEEVVVRGFDESGVPLSAETGVNAFSTGDQTLPSIAFENAHQMLISWSSQGQDGDGFGVYARQFSLSSATIAVADVVAVHDNAIPLNSTVDQWSIEPASGKPYLLLSQSNWTDADDRASALGGYLVAIGDQSENDWVWRSFSGVGVTRLLWIGLNDIANENAFEWTNGEPVSFTDWHDSQPWDNNHLGPEDFVQMGYFKCATCSKWNDLANTDYWDDRPLQGVVEFDALRPDLEAVPDETVLEQNVLQLIVGFDLAEGLMDDAASGLTDPGNWRLIQNGIDISEQISQINWLYNAGLERFEAILSFDEPLGAGEYTLIARDSIVDNYGIALDGDNDGQPGGDFARQFYIGSVPPQADAGGPYAIPEGDGLQLDASGSFDVDAESSIYWTNVTEASLQSANDDGGGLAALVNDVAQPRGMAVDPVNRFAYWTELGDPAIHRVSLDGSGTDEFIVDVRNGAAGIAFDLVAGKMYWTDSDNSEINAAIRGGKIRRANLDGSQSEDVVATDLLHPGGIAVDSIENKVYWSDVEGHLDGSGRILRANLDGSNVETLLTGIDEATGLALDQRARTLYWAESATGRIQRANLDGSGLETILEVPATTVALNVETDTLYWTEGSGNVKRARLDGSDPFTIAAGVGEPWGIGVLPPLYFSWDLNGDGDFGDAFGETPFLSWEQLAAFGINDDGEFAVRLRVTDAFGLSSVAETTLTVANAAPSGLELDPLEAYLEGSEVGLSGRFDDPGSLDIHSIAVDWGDGSAEQFELSIGDRAFTIPHRYLDDNSGGPFLATVTLTDDDGGTTFAGREIWISNAPPEVLHLEVTPAVVDEGSEVTLTGTIGDFGELDSHSVTIDWGDGIAENISVDRSLLLVVPVERDDLVPPVLMFELEQDGSATGLPSIPTDDTTKLYDPLGAVFNTSGELFISNRHGNGDEGSISRFRLLADGSFRFNGSIIGNDLAGVHDLAFSLAGELFAANRSNGLISRYLFDAEGNAIANGSFVGPTSPLGLAFSASGELFASTYLGVNRYLFDESGATIPNGSFAIPGETSHQFVEFGPGNELFVPTNGGTTGEVYRFLLDDLGQLIPNGVIEISGSAAGVAFTPEGEMFVTSSQGPIQRFVFDEQGVAQPNGTLPYVGLGAPAIFDLRTFDAKHQYLDDDPSGTPADSYAISVMVSDDDGGMDMTGASVTVVNVAPTVSITAIPIVVNVGQPFTLQASVDDPGALDSIDLSWEVTRAGEVVAIGAGDSFTFTPASSAAYQFTLTGTDDDGGVGIAQVVLEAGPCRVPGDTNQDCRVDVVDLNNVRNHFGETGLGVVDLSFNAPSPGTLLDKDGVGVGFTHRLPGTGDGLSNTDANTDLEPGINGRLLLKSTNSNANGGANLGILEAPGVFQAGIGQDDFNLTATFLDVQLPNSGDNLTLYAGTAWNNTVRVGFHESNVYHIAINRGFGDEILYSTAVNAFAAGDDVTLTLSRRMGSWSVSWQNHTNSSASGESTAFELAFLNVESDVYLGVQHTSPTTTVQQTATIDSFTLDILRPIPGDSNRDFIVNLIDLNAVRNNFGTSFPAPHASGSADDVTVGRPKSSARPKAFNLVDAVFAQFAGKSDGGPFEFKRTHRKVRETGWH